MNRPFFPKIVVYSELPQWIIASDSAAYTPHLRTIYIRDDQGLLTLVHEIIHWVIDILGGIHSDHLRYDKFWHKRFSND